MKYIEHSILIHWWYLILNYSVQIFYILPYICMHPIVFYKMWFYPIPTDYCFQRYRPERARATCIRWSADRPHDWLSRMKIVCELSSLSLHRQSTHQIERWNMCNFEWLTNSIQNWFGSLFELISSNRPDGIWSLWCISYAAADAAMNLAVYQDCDTKQWNWIVTTNSYCIEWMKKWNIQKSIIAATAITLLHVPSPFGWNVRNISKQVQRSEFRWVNIQFRKRFT